MTEHSLLDAPDQWEGRGKILVLSTSSGGKAQDATRFWFDTPANLRREMKDRERRFDDKTEVRGKIAEPLKQGPGMRRSSTVSTS